MALKGQYFEKIEWWLHTDVGRKTYNRVRRRMRRSSVRVRRSSLGSASAYCKAGPSSVFGSASHGGSSLFFLLSEKR
jgi:hypothetical protein